VVHAAAHTHVSDERAEASDCLETNTYGTEGLVKAAAHAGVRRLVFLSTVKVNGETTDGRGPFTAVDVPRPRGLYALSKWQAEQRAFAAAQGSPLELTILRLPLVYGPGVGANFLRLMHWVERRWPLPFAAVNNARSLVSTWNLSDLVALLLEHPAATGVWMVSDACDLSTPGLLRLMGIALHRPARLFPVPLRVLRTLGAVSGAGAQLERLCGSLTVDISPLAERLGWRPPVTVEESLTRTADWFRSSEHNKLR
jgi:nucleoside-diphosphate-sugar epimerase